MTSPWEDGNPKSQVIILGEAPARTEMRVGRPLVGPSGALLEQCMHSAKLIRRECYVLNVFPMEVKKSRDGKVISDRHGDILWTQKNGLTEYGEKASQETQQRIANSSANLVVPLGGTALSFAFNDERIMKWRGSILSGTDRVSNKKVIPTVHPAAVLRGQYLWRHLLVSDLDRIKKEKEYPDLNLPDRTLLIDPTLEEVKSFLHECKEQKRVAYDIECLNHHISCISFSYDPSFSMSIPLLNRKGGDRWSVEQELEIWLLIEGIINDPDIMNVNQNVLFDMSFMLKQNAIFPQGPIGDPMIAHHIMYPDFPKGLDFLCSMHTREPYYKDDGKLWSKPWRNMELFWEYNARDSAVALEIWNELEGKLDEQGFRKTYEDTVSMFPILLYMGQRGIHVNRSRLKETSQRVKNEIMAKEKELESVADYPFNISSPKQCQEYFYIHKGIKPYTNRSTGKPTTDDKAMSRIYRRFHLPEAKLVQELRALEKLHGTYLEVGIDSDDRIRSSWNPRGTKFGRFSSSKTIFGTGMNLQNLHPEFKEFLVTDEVV